MHIGTRIEVIGRIFTHCILPDLMGGRGLISSAQENLTVYRCLGIFPSWVHVETRVARRALDPFWRSLRFDMPCSIRTLFFTAIASRVEVLAPIYHAGTRLPSLVLMKHSCIGCHLQTQAFISPIEQNVTRHSWLETIRNGRTQRAHR